MKKSLFALALTSALAFTSAQAVTANEAINAAQYTKGTTFYGSMRLGVEYGKNHTNSEGKAVRGFDVKDYNSRLGFKGGEDLGNGTWAIYHAEFGFNAAGDNAETFTARNAFVGFYGADWGALTIGRQDNPFNVSVLKGTAMDDYYMTAGDYSSATAWAASFNVNTDVTSRVGNSIAYTSPNFGGFDFQTAIIANDANSKRGVDAWVVGLNYKHESGFVANAAYIQTEKGTYGVEEGTKSPYAYGVKLGYESDAFNIAATYAGGQEKLDKDNTDKVSGWDVGADYSFGPDLASTVRANFGQGKQKDGEKVTIWAVGFEQDLSSRTAAFVEYGNYKFKESSDAKKVKTDKVALGIRHNF